LEYAKYKNLPTVGSLAHHLYMGRVELSGPVPPPEIEMTDDPPLPQAAAPSAERKPLTPAAQRALAEAEARRKQAEANARPVAREFQGPKGPEPTRYGDWETKGIASDF
jgi:hypothetical protein